MLFDGDPAAPSLDVLWDLAADTGDHRARRVGAVPDGLPQGRRHARRGAICAGSARPARRCRRPGSAGSTTRSACRCRRSPAAPTCARRSSGRRRWSRCGPGRSAAGCSAAPSRRSRPTAGRARPGVTGELVDHRADAVDARRASGATTTAAATAPPTSRTSPASGATATGSRSPTTARASSAGAPTPRSTGAACASARATSTPSSRASPRSSTASSCTSRTTTAAGSAGCAVRHARAGAELDDDLDGAAPRGAAHRAVAAPRARRDRGRPVRPAHAVGEEAGGAREADPDRNPAGRRRRPRLARRPGGPRVVRRDGRRR